MRFVLAALLTVAGGARVTLAEALAPSLSAAVLRSGDAIVIDVRERDEIRQGMIAGARWIPMSAIRSKDARYLQEMPRLPKDRQIFIYCAAGVRAAKFGDQLRSEGYKKVINAGGFADLKAAGLPVLVPDLQKPPYR